MRFVNKKSFDTSHPKKLQRLSHCDPGRNQLMYINKFFISFFVKTFV